MLFNDAVTTVMLREPIFEGSERITVDRYFSTATRKL